MAQQFPLPVDVKTVEERGIPVEISDLYVVIGENRSAHLTIRGLAMYRYALARYGVTQDLSKILSVLDLLVLNKKLIRAKTHELAGELREDLNAGRVEPQARDYARQVLEGSFEALDEAGRRFEIARDAGPGVLPLPLNRKPRR